MSQVILYDYLFLLIHIFIFLELTVAVLIICFIFFEANSSYIWEMLVDDFSVWCEQRVSRPREVCKHGGHFLSGPCLSSLLR